jgi:hypothetical protein
MSYKKDEPLLEELKETIQKKDPKEPMEKTLVAFGVKRVYRSRAPRIY